MLLVAGAVSLAFAGEPSPLAPIPATEAVSTHGPYTAGTCEVCHERHEPSNPGRAIKVSNDLCYDCHDAYRGAARVPMERWLHPMNLAPCTRCHNPHNSRKPKLRL